MKNLIKFLFLVINIETIVISFFISCTTMPLTNSEIMAQYTVFMIMSLILIQSIFALGISNFGAIFAYIHTIIIIIILFKYNLSRVRKNKAKLFKRDL